MHFAFCVYGHLASLGPEECAACAAFLHHYECTIDGNVLDFVHEGHFIDVESDLERLTTLAGPHARGIIDIINHMDWEMHRCTLTNGVLTKAKVALDNALDSAYATERRS